MCKSGDISLLGQTGDYLFATCRRCGMGSIPSLDPQAIKPAYQSGISSVENGAPEDGWAPDLAFMEPAFERLSGRGARRKTRRRTASTGST